MKYRILQFLDWAYHAMKLDYRFGDETGWSWVCDKWEAMNTGESNR